MTTDIRDVKGQDPEPIKPAPVSTDIIPGNIPILTVKVLDALNKNVIVLIQQQEEMIKLIKEAADVRS